jgi:hypothetical protein
VLGLAVMFRVTGIAFIGVAIAMRMTSADHKM